MKGFIQGVSLSSVLLLRVGQTGGRAAMRRFLGEVTLGERAREVRWRRCES